jgi:hypothetical protein
MTATAALTLAGLACMAGAAGAAQPEQKPMQQAMGENFQIVTRILTELIASRYEGIGQDLDLVIAHAGRMAASPPADLVKSADDRDKFTAYAASLRTNAAQLKAVAEELAKRDREGSPSGMLSVDYLRVAASAHYGNVVTGCVLCHNQFRRRTL